MEWKDPPFPFREVKTQRIRMTRELAQTRLYPSWPKAVEALNNLAFILPLIIYRIR
jgi:hypothetical protein